MGRLTAARQQRLFCFFHLCIHLLWLKPRRPSASESPDGFVLTAGFLSAVGSDADKPFKCLSGDHVPQSQSFPLFGLE